jgi:two-component system, chemotaxis family, protein-glutamate methylesterase/glutaminase
LAGQIIVIGASLGGTAVLQYLLSELPGNFSKPIVIVQHRAKESTEILVAILARRSKLKIKEAEDKERLCDSTVYVAPADYHLLVDRGSLALSIDPPVGFARPSIDVLFESAAAAYGTNVTAIVLTGGNTDGMRGAQRIKECGGTVIIQEPTECAADRLPLSAISAVAFDSILSSRDIASYLVNSETVA